VSEICCEPKLQQLLSELPVLVAPQLSSRKPWVVDSTAELAVPQDLISCAPYNSLAQ